MEDDFDINDNGLGVFRALAIALPIGLLIWFCVGYAISVVLAIL